LFDILIFIVISCFAIDVVIIIIGSIINVSHCDFVTIDIVVDAIDHEVVGKGGGGCANEGEGQQDDA